MGSTYPLASSSTSQETLKRSLNRLPMMTRYVPDTSSSSDRGMTPGPRVMLWRRYLDRVFTIHTASSRFPSIIIHLMASRVL